ncbi:MAG: hypothetical protein ACRDHK_13350 [Actinomycetota bacterium]
MAELSLAIGGLRTAIRTSDPEVAAVIETRYKGFVSPGPPDWRIEVAAQPATARPPAGDVEVRRDGPRRFSVKRSDLAGTLDLADRSGRVNLVPGEIAVESFLRIAYSLALVDVHGFLPHASCLVRADKAYLFCGPSGRGKTTVARLSHDAIVLTDELPVVKVAQGRATAYGTPFWGELARGAENRSAPLVGIYFLHHEKRHAVEPIGPGRALGRLLPNVLFFATEGGLPARVFGIAADLIEAVPSFDLRFRPDPGFWEVIDDG